MCRPEPLHFTYTFYHKSGTASIERRIIRKGKTRSGRDRERVYCMFWKNKVKYSKRQSLQKGFHVDRYKKIIIITALIGAVLIFWGFFYSREDRYSLEAPETCQILPENVWKGENGTITYEFSFDFSGDSGRCLHFVSDRQSVKVYQNGALIHSLDDGTTAVGRVPGKFYHFVKLPQAESQVLVEIQYHYYHDENIPPVFWLGDRQQMFKERIICALPAAAVYFLTFVIGVMVLLFWGVVRGSLKNSREGFYFAALLIVVGLWFIRGSELVNLLASNHIALSYAGYLLLLQIPILFFCFSVYYWDMKIKPLWENLYFTLCVLNMAVSIGLHVSGIREFKETVFTAHILLLAAFGAMFAGMFLYFRKHGSDYKVKATFFPAVLMLISTVWDFGGFYHNTLDTYRVGGLASLLFVSCVSWSVIYDLSMQLKEGRENAIYKRLAVTDLLTGLYNRNAYESWEQSCQGTIEEIGLAVCDLNNLKYYNDTFGHETGDRCIMDAVGLIREACGREGTCYRIGGDEFLVIWDRKPYSFSSSIEKCLKKLSLLQQDYNQSSEFICMQIACGYAVAEPGDTRTGDLIKRADHMMYRHKRQMKEGTENS